MVRQNHATIRMNRKCAGNQYFLIDEEGHDGGNKSHEHGGHVTQVIYTYKIFQLFLGLNFTNFYFLSILNLNFC